MNPDNCNSGFTDSTINMTSLRDFTIAYFLPATRIASLRDCPVRDKMLVVKMIREHFKVP
ncbi:MAG: hypothetical protein FD166_3103 [Bacteroidetes bacterium]|nr:MAG: hypothetical protein FD166_3103 [Bacteroidota bacterium]